MIGKIKFVYIEVIVVLSLGVTIFLGYLSNDSNLDKSLIQTVLSHSPTYSNNFNKQLDQCEQGDTQSCEKSLFTLYNFGDMKRVIEIADHRCDKGDYHQCSYVGEIYLHSVKGVAYDPIKAHAYLKRGCEGGDQKGCQLLNEFSDDNSQLFHDRSSSVDRFKSLCDKGDNESCISLAEMYHRGNGIAQDNSAALKYYKKGCNTVPPNTDHRCEGAYEIMETTGETQ